MSDLPEEDLENIETEQIEDSAELAVNFLQEKLLPLLDEFEENNPDPGYVFGVATHGLFIELVQRLGEMGYTEKDLKKEIKVYLNNSFGQILH